MSDEKRMVGDYEVTHSIHIGNKELVLGENLKNEAGDFYLTAEYAQNDIFGEYTNCLVGGNFIELAEIFANRLKAQVQELKKEYEQITAPTEPIGVDKCIPMRDCDNLANKIVVVRPSVLRAEHRIAQKQLYIARSGNGVKAESLGTAVYCDNIYSGNHTRFERYDFIGVLKPECYPDWVKNRLSIAEEIKNNPKVFEYSGYHFKPVGFFPAKDTIYSVRQYAQSDRGLGITKYDWSKAPYDYNEFYKASGNSKNDVFRCLENSKLYIPAENELFEYTGKYIENADKQHTKKKSQREVER